MIKAVLAVNVALVLCWCYRTFSLLSSDVLPMCCHPFHRKGSQHETRNSEAHRCAQVFAENLTRNVTCQNYGLPLQRTPLEMGLLSYEHLGAVSSQRTSRDLPCWQAEHYSTREMQASVLNRAR